MLPGLNQEFLARCISTKDLENEDCVAQAMDADEVIRQTGTIIKYGFAALALERIRVRKNDAYHVRSTPHEIVLRGLSRIIKQAARLKPSDRDTVIRRIQTVLSEGVHHRVYKFDIRTFFESVDVVDLFSGLANLQSMPRSATLVLENYLNELGRRGIAGIPRGVPLSATLSEYALKSFDERLSVLPDVYFHARYVDDIIVVTGGRENPEQFVKSIEGLLPVGLELNIAKGKLIDLPMQNSNNTPAVLGQFDYLGYCFRIHEISRNGRRQVRKVDISIAEKKLNRIKSRLSLAVRQLVHDGDTNMFRRQMQLLTGNYNVRDFSTGRERNVGLYCNYRRLNSSSCLDELDAYLRSLLVGKRSKLAKQLAISHPNSIRRSFLIFSFAKSFNRKVFYNFSSGELLNLRRCWRDV